jgi:exosortase
MISEARPAPLPSLIAMARAHALLIIGAAIMLIPTLIALGQQSWTLEIGAHGPIVLATGIWLFFQARAELPVVSARGAAGITGAIAATGFALYIFGRAYDFISLEAMGGYLVVVALIHDHFGWRNLRQLAFPLLYLAFLIPPPGWLIDDITAPLQRFVSAVATGALSGFGYPVARNGVVIFIAQYQLLVEQACAGMNSIVGLTAVTIFYIYILHRTTWRYAVLLMLFIIPVAVVTNIARVMALVLVTYYLGDAAAQGFLHATTGIALFGVALALIFGLDALLRSLLGSRFFSAAAA